MKLKQTLYTEAEVRENVELAVVQAVAMCFATLEINYGWKKKRLTDFFENVKSVADMPPIFGESLTAFDAMEHLKEKYDIDLSVIKLKVKRL